MRKAANDRGSFVNARKFEVDGLLRQLGNSLAHALYRAGDGTVGRGDSAWTITGTVITLATRADAKFFGLGMQLDFIAPTVGGAPSGAAACTRGDLPRGRDQGRRGRGAITCALDSNGAAVSNISSYYTSLANTDWIAPVGDYNSELRSPRARQGEAASRRGFPLTAPTGW
jgi:hypothetical protein